jgi:hypothetical protein
MVATCKYKEIYDMQGSRRKATWFNMQKPVVNNYALGILVLTSQHLLKVLTSIASQSLIVTDPVIPRSEIAETKPPYVCPGCFIHTYSNNMINRFHVQ